jgi:hypothetical protein
MPPLLAAMLPLPLPLLATMLPPRRLPFRRLPLRVVLPLKVRLPSRVVLPLRVRLLSRVATRVVSPVPRTLSSKTTLVPTAPLATLKLPFA